MYLRLILVQRILTMNNNKPILRFNHIIRNRLYSHHPITIGYLPNIEPLKQYFLCQSGNSVERFCGNIHPPGRAVQPAIIEAQLLKEHNIEDLVNTTVKDMSIPVIQTCRQCYTLMVEQARDYLTVWRSSTGVKIWYFRQSSLLPH